MMIACLFALRNLDHFSFNHALIYIRCLLGGLGFVNFVFMIFIGNVDGILFSVWEAPSVHYVLDFGKRYN